MQKSNQLVKQLNLWRRRKRMWTWAVSLEMTVITEWFEMNHFILRSTNAIYRMHHTIIEFPSLDYRKVEIRSS